MTVSPAVFAALVIATLVVALLPIGLYRLVAKRMALDRHDAIVGIAAFTLFAMLLERGVYALLLSRPSTMVWFAKPVAFLVFGAALAAVFEEVGRFAGLRFLDRRYGASDGDSRGLGNGIGHGGAQAWFVGVVVLGQWVYLAWLANHGQLDAQLATMPADLALRLQVMLATMSVPSIAVTAIERIAAFAFQILLSVLMWRGMRAGKRWILPAMIALHPLGDLPSILYNIGALPFEWMEGLYAMGTVAIAGALAKFCRPSARPA